MVNRMNRTPVAPAVGVTSLILPLFAEVKVPVAA
jgi:hypothetical protein